MTLQSDLVARVLDLSPQDRAQLARELISSLEPAGTDRNADAAWEAEIEQRLTAVDQGEVALVDWRESIERIRANLKTRQP